MYAYYQELERFVQEQRELASQNSSINLGASEIYQAALTELNQGKEYYNQLKEIYASSSDIALELASYETTFDDGKTILDIENLSDYQEFEENYINTLAKEQNILDKNSQAYKDLVAQAKQYLSTQEDLSKFSLYSQGFKDIENNKEIDEIKEYFNSLSESEQEAFWTIGINESTSLDYIKNYMEYAQDYLDANYI